MKYFCFRYVKINTNNIRLQRTFFWLSHTITYAPIDRELQLLFYGWIRKNIDHERIINQNFENYLSIIMQYSNMSGKRNIFIPSSHLIYLDPYMRYHSKIWHPYSPMRYHSIRFFPWKYDNIIWMSRFGKICIVSKRGAMYIVWFNACDKKQSLTVQVRSKSKTEKAKQTHLQYDLMPSQFEFIYNFPTTQLVRRTKFEKKPDIFVETEIVPQLLILKPAKLVCSYGFHLEEEDQYYLEENSVYYEVRDIVDIKGQLDKLMIYKELIISIKMWGSSQSRILFRHETPTNEIYNEQTE